MFFNLHWIFIILSINVWSISFAETDPNEDNLIPFVSRIHPIFPRYVRRSYDQHFNGTQRYGRYEVHKIIITFKNCIKTYSWVQRERILVGSYAETKLSILVNFNKDMRPVKCNISYDIKVPYNLNGYALVVVYQRVRLERVENSYAVKFNFADLQLEFDKLIYSSEDEITVRCALLTPTFKVISEEINIVSFDNHIEVIRKRLLNNNHVMEMVGKINPSVKTLNFTCTFMDIVINKAAIYEEENKLIPMVVLNHMALAICLVFFLVVLMTIGTYTLIIGRKRRLIYDVTAYFTELVEDRAIRFADPILNNLTSPMRKYSIPGMLTAYQLRRNFNRLIDMLLALYPKEENAKSIVEDGDHSKLSTQFNPLLDSSLGDQIIIGLGPKPQDTVKIILPTPEESSSTDTSKTKTTSEEVSDLGRSVDSDASIDPHIISTLPYINVVRPPKPPYWAAKDSNIPVQTGVTFAKLTDR